MKRRHWLYAALPRVPVGERAEQAQQPEPTLLRQRDRRTDEVGVEHRVGVGKEKQIARSAIGAETRRVALAGPVVRTHVVVDERDAGIVGGVRLEDASGPIGAPIEHEDYLERFVAEGAQ